MGTNPLLYTGKPKNNLLVVTKGVIKFDGPRFRLPFA